MVTFVCERCGGTKLIPECRLRLGEGRFCSRRCSNAASKREGEKNPNWRGGATPLRKKIRESAEYKTWRIAVFQRDKFTCQHCQQVGGDLHADHIKQFAYYPELRFSVGNGRTLCRECHVATGTYGLRLRGVAPDYSAVS